MKTLFLAYLMTSAEDNFSAPESALLVANYVLRAINDPVFQVIRLKF